VGANQWDTLTYTVPAGSVPPTIRLQYWNGSAWALIPDSDLQSNSTTGLPSGQDLSGLGSLPSLSYTTLRVEADFVDQPSTQRLSSWQVTLLPDTGPCAGSM